MVRGNHQPPKRSAWLRDREIMAQIALDMLLWRQNMIGIMTSKTVTDEAKAQHATTIYGICFERFQELVF